MIKARHIQHVEERLFCDKCGEELEQVGEQSNVYTYLCSNKHSHLDRTYYPRTVTIPMGEWHELREDQ